MAIIYVDPENGNDSNSGLSFALAKRTLNNATSSRASGDEVRVKTSPIQNIGSSTWTSNQKSTATSISSVTINANNTFTITLSAAQTSWVAGDFIQIANNTKTRLGTSDSLLYLNGIWRISEVFSSTVFIFDEFDYPDAINLGSGSYGSAQQVSGAVVQLDNILAQQLVPNSWSVIGSGSPQTVTFPDPNKTFITGVYSSSSVISGTTPDGTNSYLVPKTQSAQRITWSGTSASITDLSYSNYFYSRSGYTTALNSSVDNNYYGISTPFNFFYNGSQYNVVYVNTNSYLTFGNATTQGTGLSASSPFMNKLFITAGDFSAQYIGYKTIGSAPNRTFCILYEGYNNFSQQGLSNMIYEVFFQENGSNPIIIDVITHTNANYITAVLSPYVYRSNGKFGDGATIELGGASGNFGQALLDPIDISSYNKFSFNIKRDTTALPSTSYTLTVELEDTSENSYVTSTVNLTNDLFSSSEWQNVTVNYSKSSPFSPDKINFYISSSVSQLLSIRISNFTALNSNISFSSLVGRNTSDSTWYKINGIIKKYLKTLIYLEEYNDTPATFPGVTYFNGSKVKNEDSGDVVELFNSDCYAVEPFFVSGTNGYINSSLITVSGGWNSTDMSTQTGKTFYRSNPLISTSYGILFNTSIVIVTLDNFGVFGFNSAGIYVSNGCRSHTIKNCDANYNSDGIFMFNTSRHYIENVNTVANSVGGIVLSGADSCVLKNIISDCNSIGIDVGYSNSNGSSGGSLSNCKIRGSRTYGLDMYRAMEVSSYNLEISASYGRCIYYNNSANHKVNGLILSRAKTNTTVPIYNLNSYGQYYSKFENTNLAQVEFTYTYQHCLFVFQNESSGDKFNAMLFPAAVIDKNNTTTLWDNSVQKTWRINWTASNYGITSQQTAYSLTMAEIAVLQNNPVSVIVRAKADSGAYARLRIDLLLSDTDDNITVDPISQTISSSNWDVYSIQYTPEKDGVLVVVMDYWYSNNAGVSLWFDDFKVI